MNDNFSTIKNLIKGQPIITINTDQKFEKIFLLPPDQKRKGEGGLRTKGYFKISQSNKPLITVCTVVFNGEKYLEQTILTVLNQTYDNIEYIIIDGGSTDKTIDIIQKYDRAIDYWVSEPDQGISDAFNKGVQLALGDYINFQGDGDGFCDISIIEKIVDGIEPSRDMLICGRIIRINSDGTQLYISQLKTKFNKVSLLFRMSLPHQGLFTNLAMFKTYGLFDIDNIYCMDYEHLLRYYQDFPEVILKPIDVAFWRADGIGTNKTLEILEEYHRIKVKNRLMPAGFLYILKIYLLLKFFVKQSLVKLCFVKEISE